uniref:Uncharacterized protein n=1 Tax=Arundo donax TaxID=35708 RepID=A0A0A8Y7A3_ARUDO
MPVRGCSPTSRPTTASTRSSSTWKRQEAWSTCFCRFTVQ